jgi:hypothetical protein
LSATQLNATASVPGTFVYTPPAGTVLGAGSQTLAVTFTPTDTTDYNTATASVAITVDPAVTTKANPIVYVSEITTISNGTSSGTFSGLIEAFSLDSSSGNLTPIPGSPFATNYGYLDDMELSPDGSFAYVVAESYPAGTCCVGTSSILVYALDPVSGAPTLKQALAVGTSPGAVFVHPSGRFIYLTPYSDSSGNTGTGIFSVQSDGTLAFSSFLQGQSGGLISPDGAFLYAVLAGSPVGNWPNTSPCGPINWTVTAFRIDPSSGALSPAAGSPLSLQLENCDVGRLPQTLPALIDPSGKRLFMPDIISSSIAVVGIDPPTGALSLLPGTTNGSIGYSEVMDPLGRFLYFGSFTGFSLAGNQASGILTPLPGGPLQVTPVQSYPEASSTMAIDPSGAYVLSTWSYFVDGFGCCTPPWTLVEFQINPNTGVLAQVPSTPITLVGGVSKIVVVQPK